MKKLSLIVTTLLVFAMQFAYAQGPRLFVDDVMLIDGQGTITIRFESDKDDYYGNFQMDLLLPEEISPVLGRDGIKADQTSMTDAGFTLAANVMTITAPQDINYGKKVLRLIASNIGGYALRGVSGTLVTIPVSCDATLEGTYAGKLNNITINAAVLYSDDTSNPDRAKEFLPAEVNFTLTPTHGEAVHDPSFALFAEDASCRVSKSVALPIALNNPKDIQGMQFDIHLPQGVSIEKSGRTWLISLSDRAEGFTTNGEQKGEGHYRFVCTSNDGTYGTEGTVMYITLQLSDDIAEGDYWIELTDIELSTTDNQRILPMNSSSKFTVKPYVLVGDANEDDVVTVTDATMTINHILGKKPDGFCFGAADVVEDGTINVSDVSAIINIVLGHAYNSGDENNAGNSDETTTYYYVGTTKPTAANIKTLANYHSLSEMNGKSIHVNAGETIYLVCPTGELTEASRKNGNLEDSDGYYKFQKDSDTTSIEGYTIYHSLTWDSAGTFTLRNL